MYQFDEVYHNRIICVSDRGCWSEVSYQKCIRLTSRIKIVSKSYQKCMVRAAQASTVLLERPRSLLTISKLNNDEVCKMHNDEVCNAHWIDVPIVSLRVDNW